jgi:TolB protein
MFPLFRAARARHLLSSVAVLGGVLITGGCGADATAPPVTASGSRPIVVTAAAPAPPGAATEPAGSVRGLPGTLYYFDERAGLRRLNLGGTLTTVVRDGAYTADVSPNGRRIAWVDSGFDLKVAGADGRDAKKIAAGVAGGYGFDPVWSADGTRVLTGVAGRDGQVDIEADPAVVSVADRKITKLPAAIGDGIHYHWSGDGTRIFFTDGECRVFGAAADGTGKRKVPVLGEDDTVANPASARACDVVSVNHDGSRISVDLHVGQEPDGDIAGTRVADAVVDTATGKVQPIPVAGAVLAALYQTDGRLLVRSEAKGVRTLTVLSPAFEVLATVPEPAAVKKLALYDWTR